MCATYCAPMSEEEVLQIVRKINESRSREERQVSFDLESIEGVESTPQKDYIVRPTDYAPVLTLGGYRKMRFGFRAGHSAAPLFNARSESVHLKRTFARHYAERRCLVPAAYYMEKGIRFCLPGSKTMYLAGVYRENAQGQCEYVILTRDSSGSSAVKTVHDRMPVIIPEHMRRAWLEEGLGMDSAVNEVETC